MNAAVQPCGPKAAGSWAIFTRGLAAIIIPIAVIIFLANAVGIAGVLMVRRPVKESVTTLSAFVDGKLVIVKQTLERVGTRADEGRAALARVNDAASKVNDRLDERGPLLGALIDRIRADLVPKMAEVRAQASALRDAAASVNGTLQMLDGLGFINVPVFTDQLRAIDERVESAQGNVQELRAAIEAARTETAANIVAGVTARTNRIDTVMAQIGSTTVEYQSAVAKKRQQVADFSHKCLHTINLLVLFVSVLLLMVAGGQLLLVIFCWQYVRHGCFPSWRSSQTLTAAPVTD